MLKYHQLLEDPDHSSYFSFFNSIHTYKVWLHSHYKTIITEKAGFPLMLIPCLSPLALGFLCILIELFLYAQLFSILF